MNGCRGRVIIKDANTGIRAQFRGLVALFDAGEYPGGLNQLRVYGRGRLAAADNGAVFEADEKQQAVLKRFNASLERIRLPAGMAELKLPPPETKRWTVRRKAAVGNATMTSTAYRACERPV